MSTPRPSPVAESRVASVRGGVPVRVRAGRGLTHTTSSHEPPIQYMLFWSFVTPRLFERQSRTDRSTDRSTVRPFDARINHRSVTREIDRGVERVRFGSFRFGSFRFFSVHQFASH